MIKKKHPINKLDYLARQFSRAEKKKYEHYAITRIWHLLNDLSLKPITQQYVVRGKKVRALTDLYFPQLSLHIEIDERHHKKQVNFDAERELDIVNATGHEILRIDITKNIENVNSQIQGIVDRIREIKSSLNDFKSWDIEADHSPQTYIAKGYMDTKEDVSFRTIADACNCFGHNYKGHQKAVSRHPDPDTILWFPKLYPNGHWLNIISDDEKIIKERAEQPRNIAKHVEHNKRKYFSKGVNKRIVFARVKSPLGDIMYRFKGIYQLDDKKSNKRVGLFWNRIDTRVKTYHKMRFK